MKRAAYGGIAAAERIANGLLRANRKLFAVGFDGGRPLYRTMYESA